MPFVGTDNRFDLHVSHIASVRSYSGRILNGLLESCNEVRNTAISTTKPAFDQQAIVSYTRNISFKSRYQIRLISLFAQAA